MKKFAALLVLLSVLMCAACTKETAREIDVNYTDNYIYANMNGTFFRFCVDQRNGIAALSRPFVRAQR